MQLDEDNQNSTELVFQKDSLFFFTMTRQTFTIVQVLLCVFDFFSTSLVWNDSYHSTDNACAKIAH